LPGRTTILILLAVLLVAGCTAEQAGDTLELQQKIADHALTLQAVWSNPGYDQQTKLQMTNDLSAKWLQDAGLASAEDIGKTQQFVNYLVNGIAIAGGQVNAVSIGSLILAGVLTYLLKKKTKE
jgi:hypothetical protein